jgi:Ca2+-binding RTX toxin-like protein
MALLSNFDVSLSEIDLLGQASLAAFPGNPIPEGWSVLTPAQLGVSSAYWDGDFFTNHGASAIVLADGSSYIVAFRGTDGTDDIFQFPQLFFGNYIDNFQPLLSALAADTSSNASFYFTGASLGGGATNQMANIAGSQYGGHFAAAKFVAFASPNISTTNGILNIGAENDPVFKLLANYADSPSAINHLVLATTEYMDGNFDGRHPFDAYAHSGGAGFDALHQMSQSVFTDQMNQNSVIILDASPGLVKDITPGREDVGAFYIGSQSDDIMQGNRGADRLEGFAGRDVLMGALGSDAIDGGIGNDKLFGGPGPDTFKFDADFGHDVIGRFTANFDKIDLSALGTNFAHIQVTQHGGDSFVWTHEGTILVEHAPVLHASDFIF